MSDLVSHFWKRASDLEAENARLRELIEKLHGALKLVKSDSENHSRVPGFRYGPQSTVCKALDLYDRYKRENEQRDQVQKP